MSKRFIVPVTYSFTGFIELNADNISQAKEYVEKHCGMVIGNITTSLSDKQDVDWDFPVHPDKTIGKPKLA
jgi:hypothetical protein